jgi:hypothetical protein
LSYFKNIYNFLIVSLFTTLKNKTMKKNLFFFVSTFMLVFTACETLPTEEIFQEEAELKSAKVVMNFRAHLNGAQEVPPVETNATGQATFQLSKDGTELSYKLIVANLDNLSAAHIHLAPAGTNGGVVVWLYPSSAPGVLIPGTSNGILAEGVITESNLVNALDGQTLDDLIGHFQAGNAYVNVHTTFKPGGEIRGQIR